MAETEMTRMMRMRAGSLVSAMARDRGTVAKQPGSVAERLASEFAPLAGARDTALALVEALRNGDLAPTGPMGWMDVRISLVLAQESIARATAGRPPAERFDSALKEVLWMRAGGMGWGRIAFITAGRNRTGAGIPRKGGS
jgi:hypothetical protein